MQRQLHLLLVALLLVSCFSEKDAKAEYEQWKEKHRRDYGSKEEDHYRRNIFTDRLRAI